MPPYDKEKDGERRSMGEFERQMLKFMGDVREHMGKTNQYLENQPGRCASHSVSIKNVQDVQTNLERAIGYKGPDDERPIVKRVETVETAQVSYNWLYAWIGGAWTAIIAIGAWIFSQASQVHPGTVHNAAETVKKIKGGG